MSIHTEKSRAKAQDMGAAAGFASRKIWALPKREIIEVAMHLAALSTDSYDETMQQGDHGEARFWEEHDALRRNGVI